MQLKLALQGKLSDVMEKHYSEGAKAVTLGISAATNGLKTSLREQVRSAGMSSRMPTLGAVSSIRKEKRVSARPVRSILMPKRLCRALNTQALSEAKTVCGLPFRPMQSRKKHAVNV